MAHEARSNVCYAGAVYAGLSTRTFGLTIGGTDRLADSQQVMGFSISKPLDGSPASLSLGFQGDKPEVGSDIVLTLGGELLFGGTVQRVKAQIEGQLVRWNVSATDWWWELNRAALVYGRYSGSVNVIVNQILNDFTDVGFAPGYLPESLGTIDIVFDGVSVGDALRRVAKASNNGAGAFLRVTPYKRVDIATSFPDGLSLTLVNASAFHKIDIEESLDQIRTQVEARGESTQTTAQAGVGATSVSVAECGIFDPAGGSAWATGVGIVTYTAVSASSGPGTLTVSAIADDIPQNTEIRARVVVDDATAQSDLATLLGGGRSGIVTHLIEDDSWSRAEAAAIASAQLTLMKDAQSSLVLTAVAVPAAVMWTYQPGAVLSASVSSPLTVSGDYRLQRVRLGAFGPLSGTEPRFNVVVDARNTVGVNLFDLLGTVS